MTPFRSAFICRPMLHGASWVRLGVLGLLACGCSNPLPAATAGQIGCPAGEIVISDDALDSGTRTWTADCEGTRFYCSAAAPSGVNTKSRVYDVSCTKAVSDDYIAPTYVAQPVKVASVKGCQNDNDCKGDRICTKGECVSPASDQSPSMSASPPAEEVVLEEE